MPRGGRSGARAGSGAPSARITAWFDTRQDEGVTRCALVLFIRGMPIRFRRWKGLGSSALPGRGVPLPHACRPLRAASDGCVDFDCWAPGSAPVRCFPDLHSRRVPELTWRVLAGVSVLLEHRRRARAPTTAGRCPSATCRTRSASLSRNGRVRERDSSGARFLHPCRRRLCGRVLPGAGLSELLVWLRHRLFIRRLGFEDCRMEGRGSRKSNFPMDHAARRKGRRGSLCSISGAPPPRVSFTLGNTPGAYAPSADLQLRAGAPALPPGGAALRANWVSGLRIARVERSAGERSICGVRNLSAPHLRCPALRKRPVSGRLAPGAVRRHTQASGPVPARNSISGRKMRKGC